MSHLNQRRTLQALACPHAPQSGCPARAGSSPSRSHWLRVTRALACRCTARFRALLLLLGSAGIAGFCAAGLVFFANWLNEAQYLAGVASSLGMFGASVLISYLGDPYELKRSECQRLQPVRLSRVTSQPMARSGSHAAMN